MAAFAELGLGGAAFFNSPYLLGQSVDEEDLNVNQFTFGGDARLKFSILQGEALVLYAAGDVQSLNIYLDAGVVLRHPDAAPVGGSRSQLHLQHRGA